MRSNRFSKEVMTVLKRRASARGLTQANLARELGVSIPTMKRWLSGSGMTLENLKKICDFLGVSFVELATSVEDETPPHFQYTLEQENYFASHPDCLAFFDYLLRGYTPTKIQKKFRLQTSRVESYLSQLDKLGLIEWLPSNKALIKCVGEPQWRPHGPLSEKLKPIIIQDFTGTSNKRIESFQLHDYLPDDIKKIERAIQDLIGLTKQSHARASMSAEKAMSCGIFISFKNFRWSLDRFLQ